MVVLCPSCGFEPPIGAPGEGGTGGGAVEPVAAVGKVCPKCGHNLLFVEPPKDELIGTIVDDRFEVLARIGEGGMGNVYRARQRSIGREVALKVIDRAFEADVAAVKRFFREAQLASQLSHPNSVSIIEFGQHADGRLYLAMELVRGRTLFQLVRENGALPAVRVARMGAQLCDALEAAHALGIVHRDLKLDNIMVVDGTRDHVKVLDFGLARSLVDPSSRATSTGIIAGTPRYLAPEVTSRGADAAPPQDLYALGVVLGEIAVGRELWKAETMDQMLAMKLATPPELTGAAPALRSIIEALLVVDPEHRATPAVTRAGLLAIAEPGMIGVIDNGQVALTDVDIPKLESQFVLEVVPPDGAVAKVAPVPPVPPVPAGPSVASLPPVPPAAPVPSAVPVPPVPAVPPSPPKVVPSQIRESRLVYLGENPGEPTRRRPTVPPPLPASRESRRFRAGGGLSEVDDDGQAPNLELETEWHAEKAAKAANPFPEAGAMISLPNAPPIARVHRNEPKGGAGTVIISVIIGAVVAVAGVVWWQHHTAPPAPVDTVTGPQPGLGVAHNVITLHLGGDADDIVVDGKHAGRPPITLTHARDGQVLVITARFGKRVVTEHIVADSDQSIDLRLP